MTALEKALEPWGIAHRSDLLAAGATGYAIGRARHSGELFRILRAWYAKPSADPRIVEAVRVGGALSCVSELERLGLWVAPPDAVHVAVPRNASRLRSTSSARMPRNTAAPDSVVHWQPAGLALGHPVDSVANALAHAAGCLAPEFALVAIDGALNRKLVSLEALRGTFRHFPVRRQRLPSRADPGSQSGLETLARSRLRRRGIALRTQVVIAGVGRVDVLIGDRLVLELDGYGFHATGEAFESDRRRDLALHERGYLTIRLSYRQVMFEWDEAERVILELVRRGDHRWSRRGEAIS